MCHIIPNIRLASNLCTRSLSNPTQKLSLSLISPVLGLHKAKISSTRPGTQSDPNRKESSQAHSLSQPRWIPQGLSQSLNHLKHLTRRPQAVSLTREAIRMPQRPLLPVPLLRALAATPQDLPEAMMAAPEPLSAQSPRPMRARVTVGAWAPGLGQRTVIVIARVEAALAISLCLSLAWVFAATSRPGGGRLPSRLLLCDRTRTRTRASFRFFDAAFGSASAWSPGVLVVVMFSRALCGRGWFSLVRFGSEPSHLEAICG